jgi:hypothetical protein
MQIDGPADKEDAIRNPVETASPGKKRKFWIAPPMTRFNQPDLVKQTGT